MNFIIKLVMNALGIGDGAARLLLGAVAMLAIGVAVTAGVSALKRIGANEAVSNIERKDHAASEAAREARDHLRHCLERGGVQDLRTGKCDR
ncbi:hypothetical protein [Nitratireductor sp. GZWM139]|uniref:hypothetical protein n=1 Tax=Nitratireductor sp. GZWM139 TaxID=2950541 RepID=UPI0024BE5AF4|nr:hypothetical protein [Nitratireductor sp. GZWM139]MDJ1463423.1 hypothetical protein [Nitratireductor sp. GZWM139]